MKRVYLAVEAKLRKKVGRKGEDVQLKGYQREFEHNRKRNIRKKQNRN
jgi:hypothetical protein